MNKRIHGLFRSLVPVLLCCALFLPILTEWIPAQAADKAPAGPALLKQLKSALNKASQYDYGKSRETLTKVADLVRQSHQDPATEREAEKLLCQQLSAKVSLSVKDFLCQQLSLIGSHESLPALEPLLASAETANIARYALERIPGKEVDALLRKHLAGSATAGKIGIINSLGIRRDSESIPVLEGLVDHSDAGVAAAAVAALGKIGGPQALDILSRWKNPSHEKIRGPMLDAYLSGIDQLAGAGKRSEAASAYYSLMATSMPPAVRIAALRGLASVDPSAAQNSVTANLAKEEPLYQAESIRFLAGRNTPDAVKAILQNFPKLPARSQAVAIAMLAGSTDTEVRDLTAGSLQVEDIDVRLAAMHSLIETGDGSCVLPLAKIAANTKEEEQTAARQSLARLRHADVDQAISRAIESAEPKVKVELLRAMGERGSDNAAAMVLKLANGDDSQVRREALRVARDMAGPREVPELLRMLLSTDSSALRLETERALSAVLRRYSDVGIKPILEVYPKQNDPDIRASLLTVMGAVEDKAALPSVFSALKDPNQEVTRAALLALSSWPEPTSLPELLSVARQSGVEAHKVLALRGYIQVLNQTASPAKRPAAESVKLLKQLLPLAKQAEIKKTLLGALQRYTTKESLKIAKSMAKDPDVTQEADLAVKALQQQLAAQKKK